MIKRTNTLTQIALMAALQCIISPFAIVFPFSPVPISLATLMLYLSVYVLGKQNALISCGIYLLIGLVGLPVFSGFTGGIGKIMGPTGGYMIGYLFLVYISGWFIEKRNGSKRKGFTSNTLRNEKKNFAIGKLDNRRSVNAYVDYWIQGIGIVMGTAVCYIFGSAWLAYQAGMEFEAALSAGVLPFIPGDIVKVLIGIVTGNRIRKRLLKAGVL